MANRSKLFIAAGAIGLLSVSLVVYQSFFSCVLSKTQAKEMVLTELFRRGFDAKFLQGPTQVLDSCSYDFYYEGGGQKISYVVIEDLPYGPELTSWDYAADKNGP